MLDRVRDMTKLVVDVEFDVFDKKTFSDWADIDSDFEAEKETIERSTKELIDALSNKVGQPVKLEVQRGDAREAKVRNPRRGRTRGRGPATRRGRAPRRTSGPATARAGRAALASSEGGARERRRSRRRAGPSQAGPGRARPLSCLNHEDVIVNAT